MSINRIMKRFLTVSLAVIFAESTIIVKASYKNREKATASEASPAASISANAAASVALAESRVTLDPRRIATHYFLQTLLIPC